MELRLKEAVKNSANQQEHIPLTDLQHVKLKWNVNNRSMLIAELRPKASEGLWRDYVIEVRI